MGGPLCYFLYCRLRLLKVALGTTNIAIDIIFNLGILMNRDIHSINLEGMLNLALDSRCLGILDCQLALLRDNIHVLLTSTCPAHSG